MARMEDPEAAVIKTGTEKEQLAKFLRDEALKSQGTTLSLLDRLRRNRKARGGVGAPLEQPKHLKATSAIILTDADINDAKPMDPMQKGEGWSRGFAGED